MLITDWRRIYFLVESRLSARASTRPERRNVAHAALFDFFEALFHLGLQLVVLDRLTDFLLDSNRFNVAASQMMRKVVVVGGSGSFLVNSQSTDDFDDHSLWLNFYGHMGRFEDADGHDLAALTDIGGYEEIVEETFVRFSTSSPWNMGETH